MGITIIAVGRLKEKFYREAVMEYTKRLSRYCKLVITEVPDEKTPDHSSITEAEKIKEKEGQRILKYVKEDAFLIALEIQGKKLNSVEFAEKIELLGIQGESNLVFVIGGSLGLHESVLKRADELLSFSEMTFPHQLMRVILLEQLYRGYRIVNHEPYHK